MYISVVICTRNRAGMLRGTLNSLFTAENLKLPSWEVLVVETSTDNTIEVCREFQRQFPRHFRFLTEKKLGKSHALNTAVVAAKGDVLAFIDDDVICDANYINSIITVFSSCSADAAQGRVLLDCEGGYPEWLGTGDFAQMADLRDFGDEVKEWQGTLCGTNMIVRAEVFRKSGSYAPELGPSPSGVGMWEDTEISLRMRQAGCRMIWAPQIVVRHQWEKGRLNKAFIRSRFFGQGRAQAYYDDLPVSFLRFGLYVAREAVAGELEAFWYRCSGQPVRALERQCEVRGYAGLLWQHWLFKRGLPRRLSTDLLAYPPSETQPEDRHANLIPR
jgi:glucosyl-dolichyl phosphate glucuronosyltransferase